MLHKTCLALIALVSAALCGPVHAEERRIALVISNQNYTPDLGALALTHADGDKIESALKASGFLVMRGRDLDSDGMDAAFRDFEVSISTEAQNGHEVIAFFYASMHGASAEVEGRSRNFLLPVDEDLTTVGQLIRKGFRLDQLIRGFAATGAKAVIVVSDACRNNFAKAYTRGNDKGFSIERGGPGVFIVFATAEGATAPDDGVFADALAAQIREPGRHASYAMLRTVENVARRRTWDSQPFMSSGGLPENFCFNGCEPAPPPGRDNIIATVSTEISIPVLFPSALAMSADAAPPGISATRGGYIATFDLPDYVVILTGQAKARRGAVASEEFRFSAGTDSAQLSFSRYGADYLLVFNCREVSESDACMSRDEAVAFAESMFVVQTGEPPTAPPPEIP